MMGKKQNIILRRNIWKEYDIRVQYLKHLKITEKKQKGSQVKGKMSKWYE